MNARDAARDLLRFLGTPAWAVSVAMTLEGEATILIVRIDPTYRMPVTVPETFQGFPVKTEWRPAARAQI
jgi:hypothetical protein